MSSNGQCRSFQLQVDECILGKFHQVSPVCSGARGAETLERSADSQAGDVCDGILERIAIVSSKL